jgi:hypothetical protein
MAVQGSEEALAAAGLKQGMRVLPETSMCGHSVLWMDQDLEVSDLSTDWRFRQVASRRFREEKARARARACAHARLLVPLTGETLMSLPKVVCDLTAAQ